MRPARQTKPDACMRWEWTETRLGAKPATMPSSAVETILYLSAHGTSGMHALEMSHEARFVH